MIKLGIDETACQFILTGDLKEVLSTPEVKFYLKDFLNAVFTDPERIVINYEKDSKEKILEKIRSALSRYGLGEEKSDAIKKVMKDYFQEEKNFESFSEKAKTIRDNKCNKEEFKKFTEVIKMRMPNRVLYPLQLLSAYHLAFSQNACNFSVPGSGKTSIVYGAYSYLNSLDPDDSKYVDNLLIIGPLSSFGPWEVEYKECFGKRPQSKRLLGNIPRNERVNYLFSQNPSKITLISYQGIPSLIDDLASFLRRNKTMVILDEAHKIKNIEGGIIAQSVLALSRYCKSRVVLTGTPLPNGFEDMINLYRFIWPTKDIIRYHLSQLKQMSNNPQDNRIRGLINNISPFFIRIKKSDLKLPSPIENPPIYVNMGQKQRKIYDFIENKYVQSLMNDPNAQKAGDLLTRARLIRLMQAATNPALLKKPLERYFHEEGLTDNILIDDSEIMHSILSYGDMEIPSKFIAVERLVQEIIKSGQKVIIWTTFVQNIHELSSHLTSKGMANKIIYGDIPVDLNEDDEYAETREKIIKEFHEENSKFKVLIANPFSVSESISLHKACHNAIYLERTFNAGQFIQSKDRIHRYGLEESDITNYYYILSEDSIDDTIHQRLIFKEKRMNDAIEKQPIPLFFNVDNDELADQDIKAIIEDYVTRTK